MMYPEFRLVGDSECVCSLRQSIKPVVPGRARARSNRLEFTYSAEALVRVTSAFDELEHGKIQISCAGLQEISMAPKLLP
jgi:hypothetical protein